MPSRVLSTDHNGGVSKNVYYDTVRKYDDLNRQEMALKAKFKAFWKRAEDDGIVKKDFTDIMKERARLPGERDASETRKQAYRKFLNFPEAEGIPARPEYKDEVGLSDEERQEKWKKDGYVVGVVGGNRDVCPHEDPNSLGARFWMQGYDEGQAELAKGIKTKPKEDPAPAAKEPIADAGKPKAEPEVERANAKAKSKGVTYWHHADLKKVYEVAQPDQGPVGSSSITKKEYGTLKANYEAAEKAAWEEAQKQPAAGETEDDDDFGDAPPAPKSA